MKRKETDILNRFYKDCGMELFKLRTEHKLNLIKLSHKTLIPAAKLDLIERAGFANQKYFETGTERKRT